MSVSKLNVYEPPVTEIEPSVKDVPLARRQASGAIERHIKAVDRSEIPPATDP